MRLQRYRTDEEYRRMGRRWLWWGPLASWLATSLLYVGIRPDQEDFLGIGAVGVLIGITSGFWLGVGYGDAYIRWHQRLYPPTDHRRGDETGQDTVGALSVRDDEPPATE